MNTQQKLNLVFSFIIIALITTVLYVSFSEDKTVNQQSDLDKRKEYQLMEVHQQNEISIEGVINASVVEEVKMNVSGKIDKNNRTLKTGSRFKKNEILIKVERLDALYELLSARSEFKELIQQLIPSINDKLPSESEKWKQFENQVQRTLPLPTMPTVKTKNEEGLLNRMNVFSQYYKTKKTELKAEDYIYIAPFDGTIIESNTGAGLSISEGKTVLRLAKNNYYQVTSHVSMKDIERIKTSDTVHFKSIEGDTLTKGLFLKAGSALSDSSTLEVYYSILSQDQKLLNKIVFTSLPVKQLKIPTRAIKNDSVEIYASDNSYKVSIRTVSTTGDSSIVKGLPEHSFIIINP